MSARVGVIACGALAVHVRAIARRRGWRLDLHPVPALHHNRPERIAPAVRAQVEALSSRYDVLACAYADCGTYGALDAALAGTGVERLCGEHCYDLFARDEVRAALEEEPGTYVLTDFLARTFEHTVLRELGLDRYPELRDDYFRHYNRMVWLAQQPDEALHVQARRAADRVGLPLTVVETGHAGLERALADLVPAQRTAISRSR
jgi:Protein of unknown function (DUF1638)